MQAASQEEEEEEEEIKAAMMSSKQYSAFMPTLFHWLQANGKPMRSIDVRLVAALVLAAAVGHRSV